MAMAVFDMIFMWSFASYYVRDQIGADSIHNPCIWAFLYTCEFFGNVAVQCSDWVLLAFSVTRLLSMLDPFGVATRFTQCRMRILVLCLIPLAAASHMYAMVEYATLQNQMANNNTWLENWSHIQNADARLVAPLSTLIALPLINAAVVGILIKRRMLHTSAAGQCVGVSNSRKWVLHIEKKKGCVTVRSHGRDQCTATTVHLLTASVVMFLISRIPLVAWYGFMHAEASCTMHLTDEQSVIFLTFFSQLLYANYSVNFLVYCGVSRKFFARAMRVIRRCRQPSGSRTHSQDCKSKNTDMTLAAAIISAELARALKTQTRRESEEPIWHL
ncbi:uncharacterized protein LOC129592478 [Paramacrobiotus metropolitanus]|uniref:uncharacterized protein LOC129592478 n=1 Tax=Paramacrobiotus metropolitanus TaxID=2943436 RepID=UPI0024458533|nr:uncharacterized protein LOC129592478 [Paramacrobiotus metropolitanus]